MEHEHGSRSCSGHAPFSIGSIWIIGWLFMIGYTHPTFWKAVLGLVVWPYYLGVAVR